MRVGVAVPCPVCAEMIPFSQAVPNADRLALELRKPYWGSTALTTLAALASPRVCPRGSAQWSDWPADFRLASSRARCGVAAVAAAAVVLGWPLLLF